MRTSTFCAWRLGTAQGRRSSRRSARYSATTPRLTSFFRCQRPTLPWVFSIIFFVALAGDWAWWVLAILAQEPLAWHRRRGWGLGLGLGWGYSSWCGVTVLLYTIPVHVYLVVFRHPGFEIFFTLRCSRDVMASWRLGLCCCCCCWTPALVSYFSFAGDFITWLFARPALVWYTERYGVLPLLVHRVFCTVYIVRSICDVTCTMFSCWDCVFSGGGLFSFFFVPLFCSLFCSLFCTAVSYTYDIQQ